MIGNLIFTCHLIFVFGFLYFPLALSCDPTSEVASAVDTTCICKPSHYLPDNEYTCRPRKSLQIVEDYELKLKTFGRYNFNLYLSDWTDNFILKVWVKHLYESSGKESIIVRRKDVLNLKRSSTLKNLEFVVATTNQGDIAYSTPANSFPSNQWVHILIIHRKVPDPVSIYLNEVKYVNAVPTYASLITQSGISSDYLTIGYNLGLISNLRFFKDIDINENFIQFYIYSYMDLFEKKVINGWDFKYTAEPGWRSIINYNLVSIPSSAISWVENDYPIICDQKYYFYDMLTGDCKQKKPIISHAGNSYLKQTPVKIVTVFKVIISMWLKQTSPSVSHMSISEIVGIAKFSIDNSVNSFEFNYIKFTLKFSPPDSGPILNTWRKLTTSIDYISYSIETYIDGQLLDQRERKLGIQDTTDAYVFGFKPPSIAEPYIGYMRDFAIMNSPLPSADWPLASLHYSQESTSRESALLLLKMSEQYGGMIFDSGLSQVTAINSDYAYIDDTSAPLLCPESTKYNDISKTCDTMPWECDYYDSSGSCVGCRLSIFTYSSITQTCVSSVDGMYRDYRQLLNCDISCMQCKGYKDNDCTDCFYPMQLNSGKCICEPGLVVYYPPLIGYPTCIPNCGDGLRYSSEDCDDGNLDNYDGCSSLCKVEANFVCLGGSVTSRDFCYCSLNIVEAAFTGGWKQIEVKFSSLVEIADGLTGTPEACQKFLSGNIIQLLGTGYSCKSTSSKIMIISLGSRASITRDTKLSFLQNGLKIPMIACKSMSYSNIAITPDPVLPSPLAVINGPQYISLCDNLIMYGSSSMSNIEALPDLNYFWAITDVIPDFSDKDVYIHQLNNFIISKNYKSTLTLFNNQLLPDKMYRIQLQVTNAAGTSHSTQSNFTTSSEIKATLIIIGPLDQTFYPWQHIVIRISVDLSRCSQKKDQNSKEYTVNDLAFAWSLVATTDSTMNTMSKITNTKANLTYLEIFPYLLNPFHKYTFSVRASIPTASNISDVKQVQINILPGPVIAYILGQNRIVFPNEIFTLDGSSSYDTSYDFLKQKIDTGFNYEWSCVYEATKNPCLFKSGTSLDSVLGCNKRISINSSEINFAQNIEVTLKVRKGLRSDSNTIIISYKDNASLLHNNNDMYLTSIIPSPYILPPLINSQRVNPDSMIVLRGQMIFSQDEIAKLNQTDIKNYYLFNWNCTAGPCEEIEFRSPSNYLAASVYIKSGILNKQIPLSFTLSVSNALFGNSTSSSTIKLSYNFPPKYGSIQVNPASGTALITTFTLTAVGWYDTDGDNPLRYEFLASEKEDFSDSFPLTDLILANEFSTILWKPLMMPSPAKLFIRVRVYDSLMAKSEVTTSVDIFSCNDSSNYLRFLANINDLYNGLIVNNVERLMKDFSVLLKQCNEAGETKKSIELQKINYSNSPLLQACQQRCLSGGQCLPDANYTKYECHCSSNNSYSSSCLYNIDEYNEEFSLKAKILQSALQLSDMQPLQPSVTKIKLNVFNEILYDASIIAKAQKQYIVRNIISDLKYSINLKEIFDSENTLHLSQNILYTNENIKTVVSIAERLLKSYPEKAHVSYLVSLEESEFSLEIITMLNMAGKAVLQNMLPGEDSRIIQSKNLNITVSRVPLEDIFSGKMNRSTAVNENLLQIKILNSSELIKSILGLNASSEDAISSLLPNSMQSLKESRFGAKYGLDIIIISSNLNLADKVSDPLIISVSEIANASFREINLTEPFIEFKLPIKMNKIDQEYIPKENYTCVYYSINSQSNNDTNLTYNISSQDLYSDTGCTSKLENDSVVCTCSHLTFFVLDIRAAKNAYKEAKNNILNPISSRPKDIIEMLSTFPFILIAFLIALNLISFYLYRIDKSDNNKDKFYDQKREMTEIIFPEPKEAIDFFAGDTLRKKELRDTLSSISFDDNSSKREINPGAGSTTFRNDVNQGILDMHNMASPFKIGETPRKKSCDITTNNNQCLSKDSGREGKSSKKRPSSPVQIQENKHTIIVISPNENQLIKENPEECIDAQKDQSVLDRSGVQLQQLNASAIIKTPEKKRISVLRGSRTGTIASSVNGKEIGNTPSKNKPSPSAFPESGGPSTSSSFRMEVPQYSVCSLKQMIRIGFKYIYPISALFLAYIPSFPRPLRLLELTTRIIGYMGVSAVFYNTSNKLRTLNESIYVGIFSSAIMAFLGILIKSCLFVNGAMIKTEDKIDKEIELKFTECISNFPASKHCFSMIEYIDIKLIKKKERYPGISYDNSRSMRFKRIIGVFLSLSCDIFFLCYLLFFCAGFESEIVKAWQISFVYSLSMDLIGSQLIKLMIAVFAVFLIERFTNSIGAHEMMVKILVMIDLKFY